MPSSKDATEKPEPPLIKPETGSFVQWVYVGTAGGNSFCEL